MVARARTHAGVGSHPHGHGNGKNVEIPDRIIVQQPSSSSISSRHRIQSSDYSVQDKDALARLRFSDFPRSRTPDPRGSTDASKTDSIISDIQASFELEEKFRKNIENFKRGESEYFFPIIIFRFPPIQR
jgi:hypothetical protein